MYPSLEYYIFDQLGEGILLFSNNSITYANKYFENLSHQTAEELKGSQKFDFLTQTQQSEFKQFLHYCTESERSFTRKFDLAEKSASNSCSTNAVVTFSKFGDTVCSIWKCDTYERDEKLQYYDQCDKYSGQSWGIIEYDEKQDDLECVFLSQTALEELAKLGSTSPLHKPWRKHNIISNDLEWWLDKVKRSMESPNEVLSYVRETQYAVGKRWKVDIKCTGNSTRTHQPQFYISSKDITFLSEIQAALPRVEIPTLAEVVGLLTGFFERSPLFMGTICLIEDNSMFVHLLANPACATLHQTTPDALRGKRATESGFTQEQIEVLIRYLLLAQQTGKPVEFEYYMANKWIMFYLAEVDVNKFSYIGRDITEKRALEEELKRSKDFLEATVEKRTQELERALQIKSRFLATMSHEIRTPLAGSISAMALLTSTTLTPEQSELLEIGLTCGKQLSSLIDEILDISKIEEHKMVLEKDSICIRDTVQQALSVVVFGAQHKKLDLICDFDLDIPKIVVGDTRRLRQILINLLSNAIKFSNSGEVVLSISMVFSGDDGSCELQFSVADNGIGIKDEDKCKIFQPFTQLDSSMARKYEGTGLGLSITKKLVEMMDGKIWFESHEGEGSTFYFTIKTKVGAVTPGVQDCKSPISFRSPQSKEILVVAPNMRFLNVIKKYLDFWEYKSVLAANMEHAMEIARSKTFDLALVEIRYELQDIEQLSDLCPVCVVGWTPRTDAAFPFIRRPVMDTLGPFLIDYFGNSKHSNIRKSSSADDEGLESDQHNCCSSPEGCGEPLASILVAEDNLMNQKIVRKILGSIGYKNVMFVENGIEAVDEVKRNRYDIVLMDIMMPEKNGIEACKDIRHHLPKECQPRAIIALTADVSLETKDKCLNAGMQDFCIKPVHHIQLKRILDTYTKKETNIEISKNFR